MARRILAVVIGLTVLALAGLALVGSGWLGERYPVLEPAPEPLPAGVVAARRDARVEAGRAAGVPAPKQILFGDLHVHTTYSTDAFLMSLPMAGGEGAHPVADACDFARFCAGLDFWSITDHALALTPQWWDETVETIRQCNARSGEGAPDTVAFLGWEWTQIGTTPKNHYGHKNVILRDTEEGRIPTRPIAAGIPPGAGLGEDDSARPSVFRLGLIGLAEPSGQGMDMIRYLRDMTSVPECAEGVPERELPDDCRERAATPAELFAKLDDWGLASLVIPHGTTWGYYTPLGSAWDKQLDDPSMHDPDRQRLIEVFSGHGNSEAYRPWREVIDHADGTRSCPEPTADFLPSCWRAGQIIFARCTDEGEDRATCEARAAEARQLYVDGDQIGHLAVPGATPEDWLDAGQCRDCFQPAFNYRPRSSVQYIMALRRPDEDGEGMRRFDFGFMASSDNHSARPGTGYKEFGRVFMTEARFARMGGPLAGDIEQEPAAKARPFDASAYQGRFFALRETERQASFFLTGGLVAAHAADRDRDAIWEALERREVYGTSGPRILLWFDLENGPDGPQPMGSQAALAGAPRFTVRAVGSLAEAPGCPDASEKGLTPERLERLCRGECYHPTARRRPITRIEVVRLRPQVRPDEPVDGLVDDPWKVIPCDGDPEGCVARFEDPAFAASGRDALYYVRAIEAPSPAVNAAGLRCERDEAGRCVEIHPCLGVPDEDDCLAETEERAWSSPIFVEHRRSTEVAAGR